MVDVRQNILKLTMLLGMLGLPATRGLAADQPNDYWPADAGLKTVKIDSSPNESFLSVRLDTSGRIFLGGREALFVYEPDDHGGYKPRQELLRFPKDTWIYDIEIRGHDLYLATVSAIYVVPGAVVNREKLEAHRLIWGVPNGHVHQCLHCLAFGPEGDLYFSMGDPLWYYGDFERPDHWGHWTFFSRPQKKPGHDGLSPLSPIKEMDDTDWTRTLYNGVGGVFRCKPDGTNLQIVCRGMRNSCGLVFDRHWNLFTNDNDHEGMPSEYVPGRLNHAVPHGYYNWPRGWLLSKTPDRADLLDTLTTKLGRAVPVGQSYYDDTLLPDTYRNQLLVARWCTRQVTRYPLRHHGVSFRTDEFSLLNGRDQARPVGVCVGRGGRIFATICYMAQNESSPVYRSELVMITRTDDSSSHPFEPYDTTTAPAKRLWKELANESWSRRQASHLELIRRSQGQTVVSEAFSFGQAATIKDLAGESLIWLSAASRTPAVREWLAELADGTRSSSPMWRLQAVRALSEFYPGAELRQPLQKALSDTDSQVRHAAVAGLWNVPGSIPQEVFSGPALSDDTYLRQAATLLIAEKDSPLQFAVLCGHPDPKTRLAGVLAAGFRLTLPPAIGDLPKQNPLIPWRKEESYVITFPDRTVDLRKLGRIGMFTIADQWKAVPHSSEQETLFKLLTQRLTDPSEPVRLQAAHFLWMLNDKRSEPLVAKVRTASETQRLATAPLKMVKKFWVAGPFPDAGQGLSGTHPPQEKTLDLNAVYPVGTKKLGWKTADVDFQLYDFRKLLGQADDASYYAYTRLESGTRQPILMLPGSDDGIEIWVNGKSVWKNDVTRSALPTQDSVLAYLQPGSNDLLIRVHNLAGESGLYFHYRGRQPVLDVLPEKMDNAGFAARLQAAAQAGDVKVDPVFLKTDWIQEARKGDKVRGRKLFGAQGLGCAKCHGITADATLNGGPSLAEAARRFTTPHLVESILFPSKQVSPVFRGTQIITQQGKTYVGLLVGETAEKVELLQSDATRISIPASQVDERKLLETSPMPTGLVKTADELRDLLAYLLGDNPQPP